ncbi:hypothetical protein TRICHSKD4_3334 [Roseibium sp. TrichSKD4]|uniref:hypothetical protein n=1 Tax=Roseibium sp. TrichSKD4 TaxID=744980 RepID=UPI0001E56F3A|nr:hypothetical protein [Roseibium sp. TrichSKD4]EFO31317.1 hypothetical protein TRICHSKD4_3334 [Roseibium sp. TrichSKD4]
MAPYKKKPRSILPDDDANTPAAIPTGPYQEGTVTDKAAAISGMVVGKASEHLAWVDSFRKADRVQMSFTAVPEPIRDMFRARATEMGLDLKGYLYHLLRQDGHPLPSQKELDGRFR